MWQQYHSHRIYVKILFMLYYFFWTFPLLSMKKTSFQIKVCQFLSQIIMRISDCPCILTYRKLNSGLIITSCIEGCILETSIFRSSLSLEKTQLYTVPQSLPINPRSMYCAVLYAKRFVFMSKKISYTMKASPQELIAFNSFCLNL